MKGRNHEVCLLRVKDVRFKENYGEGEVSDLAKTGSRMFYLIASFESVLQWLNKHPFKDNDEAYLICNPVTGEPINSDILRDWTYELRDKIKEKLKAGTISNPEEKQKLDELVKVRKWNPYCFRHSGISWDRDNYHDELVKKNAGLAKDSRRLETYHHRSVRPDDRRKILEANGIEQPEEKIKPKPSFTTCGKCMAVNSLDNKLCNKCGYPLTLEGVEKLKAEENRRFELIVEKYVNDKLEWIRELTEAKIQIQKSNRTYQLKGYICKE